MFWTYLTRLRIEGVTRGFTALPLLRKRAIIKLFSESSDVDYGSRYHKQSIEGGGRMEFFKHEKPARVLRVLTYLMLCCSILLFTSENLLAEPSNSPLNLYLSADMSGTAASSAAIRQGIETALSEVDYRLGSFSLQIVELNHRGSTPRAKKHLEQYLKDPNALVLFSGLHSPPLFAHN